MAGGYPDGFDVSYLYDRESEFDGDRLIENAERIKSGGGVNYVIADADCDERVDVVLSLSIPAPGHGLSDRELRSWLVSHVLDVVERLAPR